MPAISASAPGKIILTGEHAVVYGQPALAVPVHQVQVHVAILAAPTSPTGQVTIEAPEIGLKSNFHDLAENQPIAALLLGLMDELKISRLPAMHIKISSTIPVASGLGSGSAVSVALARSVSAFLGRPLSNEQVSQLAYRVEMIHHGTPSGIDNTVITFGMPVYFVRGMPMERLRVPVPFYLVVGHSGIQSATVDVVSDLRRRWQANPEFYQHLFEQVGEISREARSLIENGSPRSLGMWMDKNHTLLQQMDVSCKELDKLVEAARLAGALGAKLSGAGRGGNMIALVDEGNLQAVEDALTAAGASRAFRTQVGG
jgi:mevalonate kinase